MNNWMRLSTIVRIIKTEICVICQTDGQRERETETDRQTGRQTGKPDGQTVKQRQTETDRQMDVRTYRRLVEYFDKLFI